VHYVASRLKKVATRTHTVGTANTICGTVNTSYGIVVSCYYHLLKDICFTDLGVERGRKKTLCCT